MSKAKAQSIPRRAVKAPSAEYKVVKNRRARIAVKDLQMMAFLHARGLDVEPKGLAAALQVAIAQIEALYRVKPGQEGLTVEEVEAARSGGLDPQPARGARADPLVQGVVAYASLILTGLTTRQAAARLGVSDARVRQRLQARTLLAVREGLSWKLPVFQFTKRGALPGWSAGLPEPSSWCVSCRRGAMAWPPAPRPRDGRERDSDEPAWMAARGSAARGRRCPCGRAGLTRAEVPRTPNPSGVGGDRGRYPGSPGGDAYLARLLPGRDTPDDVAAIPRMGPDRRTV